jgi:hypothetical protein
MKKNLSIIDRVLRIVLVLIIVVLYLTNIITGTLALILLILGGILVITSIISFCPIYFSFGLSTAKKKE